MADQKGEKFVWLLAGLGLGAGIALLFAPESGRETRRRLTRMAEDSRDRLTESGQEILDKGRAGNRARQSGCGRGSGFRGTRPSHHSSLENRG